MKEKSGVDSGRGKTWLEPWSYLPNPNIHTTSSPHSPYSSALEMEAVGCSEIFLLIYQTTTASYLQKKVIFMITVMRTSLEMQQVYIFRSESLIVMWFNILWLLKLCSVVKKWNLCHRTLYRRRIQSLVYLHDLLSFKKSNCIKDHFSGK